MAGGFNITDTGFTTHFFWSELEISSDFIDDLFGIDRMGASGFIDGNGAVLDELEWG